MAGPTPDPQPASDRVPDNGAISTTANGLNSEPKDYGSAKAYADEVRRWYNYTRFWMASTQQQMVFQQQQLQLQYQLQQQHQQYAQMAASTANGTVGQQQPQQFRPFNVGLNVLLGRNLPNLPRVFRFGAAQNVAGVGHQRAPQTIILSQHSIPSFTRRIAAELIDCMILFFLKLMIVYLAVEFQIILSSDLDQFEYILTNEASLQMLIDVTQDLFNVELACKLVAGCLEAFCITYGLGGYPPGCTPGKYLMRIQVISCLDIHPVPGTPDRVAVTRLPNVGFRSSITRSLLKNLLTIFLFPLSTAFYVFNHNRAVYDLLAKTIVVSL